MPLVFEELREAQRRAVLEVGADGLQPERQARPRSSPAGNAVAGWPAKMAHIG